MDHDAYVAFIDSELTAAKSAAAKSVEKVQKSWKERNFSSSDIKPGKAATVQSAMDTQEGGDHYKKCKIQPLEYALENGLGICEHAVVKYITRYQDKNGVEDLKKARHYIDILIERYNNV